MMSKRKTGDSCASFRMDNLQDSVEDIHLNSSAQEKALWKLKNKRGLTDKKVEQILSRLDKEKEKKRQLHDQCVVLNQQLTEAKDYQQSLRQELQEMNLRLSDMEKSVQGEKKLQVAHLKKYEEDMKKLAPNFEEGRQCYNRKEVATKSAALHGSVCEAQRMKYEQETELAIIEGELAPLENADWEQEEKDVPLELRGSILKSIEKDLDNYREENDKKKQDEKRMEASVTSKMEEVHTLEIFK